MYICSYINDKKKQTEGKFAKGECEKERMRFAPNNGIAISNKKQCTTIYRRCSLAAALQLVAHGSKKTLQRTTVGRRLF